MKPDVFAPASLEEVTARLEALLPGLRAFALADAARTWNNRVELLARLRPGGPAPARPEGDACMLAVDRLIDGAKLLGARCESKHVDEDFSGISTDELADIVLRDLAGLDEDVYVVSSRGVCHRIHAARLHDFMRRDLTTTGDVSRDGDEVFVCTRTNHLVVSHHSGWIFRLWAPNPDAPKAGPT